MKKTAVLAIFILIKISVLGQIDTIRNDRELASFPPTIIQHLDSLGIDGSPILNKNESEYFNFYYKDSRKDFDFSGKKIGFLFSRRITDKKEYFDAERNWLSQYNRTVSANLIVFNEIQKIESGEYDAFIVYWSKFSISTEDLLKIVKKNNQKINK